MFAFAAPGRNILPTPDNSMDAFWHLQSATTHVGPVSAEPFWITNRYSLRCFYGCMAPIFYLLDWDLNMVPVDAFMDKMRVAATKVHKLEKLIGELVWPEFLRSIENREVRGKNCRILGERLRAKANWSFTVLYRTLSHALPAHHEKSVKALSLSFDALFPQSHRSNRHSDC